MDATVFEPFEVDEETALECWQFAKACNNNYSKRGQNDKQKKIRDSFEGKIGEWIVYNRLARFFADLTRPDMQIYGRGQKGWESDLFAEDLEFAVKTCKRSSWESWIFQREDEDGFGRDEGIYGEGRHRQDHRVRERLSWSRRRERQRATYSERVYPFHYNPLRDATAQAVWHPQVGTSPGLQGCDLLRRLA
jgi:hypothetical protein